MNDKHGRNLREAPRATTAASPSAALLSPQLGFVVQFRCGAGLDAGAFSGRVEHLVSGRVDHFESPRQLVEFLNRVLVENQFTKE